MDFTLLYLGDCPNRKVADEWLTALAAERPDPRVTPHLVDSPAGAQATGFSGSPSIHVDEVDVSAALDTEVGLFRRLSSAAPHTDGYEGAPTLFELRAVLDDA